MALFSPLSATGGIALTLGMIASAIVAMWIIRCCRLSGRTGGWIWAALAAVGGTFVVAVAVSVAEDSALDLNPTFTVAQLTGVWRDGKATLTLGPDGTYVCVPVNDCGLVGARGLWERSGDFNLVFRSSDGQELFERVVKFAGEFRLTEMGEVDLWKRDLTFHHSAQAS